MRYLPESRLREALNEPSAPKGERIADLAPYLPEALLNDAFARAITLRTTNDRAQAIRGLARFLPDPLLLKAWDAATKITHDEEAAPTLAVLAFWLREAGYVEQGTMAERDASERLDRLLTDQDRFRNEIHDTKQWLTAEWMPANQLAQRAARLARRGRSGEALRTLRKLRAAQRLRLTMVLDVFPFLGPLESADVLTWIRSVPSEPSSDVTAWARRQMEAGRAKTTLKALTVVPDQAQRSEVLAQLLPIMPLAAPRGRLRKHAGNCQPH